MSFKESYFKILETPFGNVEVLDFCPSAKKKSSENVDKEIVFFLTPGNPGVVSMYEDFLKSMYARFSRKIRFLSCGHLGHSKEDINNGSLFKIEDQINKTIFVLDELISEYGNNVEFVLLGHSFGSFVNTRCLIARPDLPVLFIFHLFPVIARLELSLPIRLIASNMNRKWVSLIISKVPIYTKLAIVRTLVPCSATEATIAVNHSGNPSLVENALFLTDEISLELTGDLDPELLNVLKKNGGRSLFLFTNHDKYIRPSVYSYLKELLEAENFIYIPKELNVLHAFPINERRKVVEDICFSELFKKNSFRKRLGMIMENMADLINYHAHWSDLEFIKMI